MLNYIEFWKAIIYMFSNVREIENKAFGRWYSQCWCNIKERFSPYTKIFSIYDLYCFYNFYPTIKLLKCKLIINVTRITNFFLSFNIFKFDRINTMSTAFELIGEYIERVVKKTMNEHVFNRVCIQWQMFVFHPFYVSLYTERKEMNPQERIRNRSFFYMYTSLFTERTIKRKKDKADLPPDILVPYLNNLYNRIYQYHQFLDIISRIIKNFISICAF